MLLGWTTEEKKEYPQQKNRKKKQLVVVSLKRNTLEFVEEPSTSESLTGKGNNNTRTNNVVREISREKNRISTAKNRILKKILSQSDSI